MFSEDHMASFRGTDLHLLPHRHLISIAADYYSYLGGAHPNTVYFAWNYDLTAVCSSPSRSWLLIPRLTLAVADIMIEVQARNRSHRHRN